MHASGHFWEAPVELLNNLDPSFCLMQAAMLHAQASRVATGTGAPTNITCSPSERFGHQPCHTPRRQPLTAQSCHRRTRCKQALLQWLDLELKQLWLQPDVCVPVPDVTCKGKKDFVQHVAVSQCSLAWSGLLSSILLPPTAILYCTVTHAKCVALQFIKACTSLSWPGLVPSFAAATCIRVPKPQCLRCLVSITSRQQATGVWHNSV